MGITLFAESLVSRIGAVDGAPLADWPVLVALGATLIVSIAPNRRIFTSTHSGLRHRPHLQRR
jgi:hypothetical protein